MAGGLDPSVLREPLGMTCNSDPYGNPICGALTMAGREYEAIAGAQPAGATADPSLIQKLVLQGNMVRPSLGDDDGQFPGSAGSGQIVGPLPDTAEKRLALAVIHNAMLTVECANTLGLNITWILDGTHLRDTAYAAIVSSIRAITSPNAKTLVNENADGIARGATALCHPATVEPPILREASKLNDFKGLKKYIEDWQTLVQDNF